MMQLDSMLETHLRLLGCGSHAHEYEYRGLMYGARLHMHPAAASMHV